MFEEDDQLTTTINILNKTRSEISSILTSPQTVEDKQIKLENLATPFSKEAGQLKYSLPSILKEYIERLTPLIIKEKYEGHFIGSLTDDAKSRLSEKNGIKS
jgi:hypothetical protein